MGLPYCRNRALNDMVAALVREGWTFTKGKHPRVTATNGRVVIFSDTPSDGNAHKQFRRDIDKVKAGKPIRPRAAA